MPDKQSENQVWIRYLKKMSLQLTPERLQWWWWDDSREIADCIYWTAQETSIPDQLKM